jgi:ubiquinone/menaquinone biosynthesis C-methylase UbiE
MAERVCPWWMGYVLASPIRRLMQNPEKILGPYVLPSMKVLEIGPGMGFFTIPAARMVAKEGKIVCVDLQEKMIEELMKRVNKAGLSDRVETRTCTSSSLQIDDLSGIFDLAIAFAVVHEVPDVTNLMLEIYKGLKNGGRLLISEPAGHVTEDGFRQTIASARSVGFKELESPTIQGSISQLLVKD